MRVIVSNVTEGLTSFRYFCNVLPRGEHVTKKIIEAMAGVEIAAIEHATGKVTMKRLRAARMALLDAIEEALLMATVVKGRAS